MGDSVAYQMIELLIENCENEDVKKGLQIALDVMESVGYYNLNDWEEMTEEEKLEEVKGYLKMEICTDKLKWYFKNGTKYEIYSVLYKNAPYILVQNDNSRRYSFGLISDFGTTYGFPVNWSCLSLDELKEALLNLIKIDTKYIGKTGGMSEKNIKHWKNMLSAVDMKIN